MDVRVLYDRREDKAVLYDSTTGVAFGPVFEDPLALPPEIHGIGLVAADDVAEAFLAHLREDLGVQDPRALATNTLVNHYDRWRQAVAVKEEEKA